MQQFVRISPQCRRSAQSVWSSLIAPKLQQLSCQLRVDTGSVVCPLSSEVERRDTHWPTGHHRRERTVTQRGEAPVVKRE
jgi:hypothetical protein